MKIFVQQCNFVKVNEIFFWTFKILEFSVGASEKLQGKIDLILKTIWKTSKGTAEKLRRNLMKLKKKLECLRDTKTVQKCEQWTSLRKTLKNLAFRFFSKKLKDNSANMLRKFSRHFEIISWKLLRKFSEISGIFRTEQIFWDSGKILRNFGERKNFQ